MSTEIAKLVVALEAQTAKFTKDLDATNRKIAAFEKRTQASLAKSGAAFGKFGAQVKGFIAGYIGTQLFGQILTESAEAEKTFAMLANAVANNGKQAGYTAQQLAEMASDIQSMTVYSDEAVMSMQALLLRFKNIGDFKGAQQAVLDLAAAMQMDLQAAAKLVGRALADPVKGLTMMTRAGVVFTQSQKDTIKAMVESGRKAEAQKLILDSLQATMKGAAVAARNNLGGAIEGLKNQFGDMLEMKDGVPGVTAAINDLSATLRDPAIKQGIDFVFGSIITLAVQAINVVGKLAGMMSTLALGGSGRVDQITKQIEFLESKKAPMLSIGRSFDPSGEGGVKFLFKKDREERIRQLRREQEVLLGLGAAATEAEKKMYGLSQVTTPMADAGEGLDESGGGGGSSRAASAADKATEAITKQILALQEQIATLGASEAGAAAYSATMGEMAAQFDAMGPAGEAARQQYIALVVALQDAKIAQDAEAAATAAATQEKEDAAAAIEGLKTVYDKASDSVALYNSWLEKQIITEQQRDALIKQVSMDLAEQAKKAQDAADKMSVQWDQALRNMQDILGEALFNSFEDGVEGMVLQWATALKRMAAEALAAQIFGALTAGANQGSSWLGGLVGAIFGGFTGGAGAGAGAGGGGNWVGPRAAGGSMFPGGAYLVGELGPELVTPRYPGMVLPAHTTRSLLDGRNDFDRQPIQITMNIETPDADSFMRTQTQIQARMQSALSRASARKN